MNTALREALAASRLTETDVAAHLGVDPKTVRRWLSGTRPYPRHRWALAELLQVQEDRLWPQKSHSTEKRAPLSERAHRVYPHRWEVPREVWHDLFNEAEQEIGILVYSGLFLADDAGVLQLLGAQARSGVNVRILLGEPESAPVKQRGRDEQIGEAMVGRASNAFLLFRTLHGIKRMEIRAHSTILYNSIYFTEKRILVNHHVYGLPAAKSPVIEINRNTSSEIFDIYVRSFDLVWKSSMQVRNY